MRQINFVIFFVVCLALVLFSLENTEATVITLIPGYQFRAPLAVVLFLAIGVGAIAAWIFSTWLQVQHLVESYGYKRELRKKEQHINTLEKSVEQFQTELERINTPSLPPASSPSDELADLK